MSTNSFPTPKEKALAKKARPKSVLKDTLPTPRFRGMASTLHMHTAMDNFFALIGAHYHGITKGQQTGKTRIPKTL